MAPLRTFRARQRGNSRPGSAVRRAEAMQGGAAAGSKAGALMAAGAGGPNGGAAAASAQGVAGATRLAMGPSSSGRLLRDSSACQPGATPLPEARFALLHGRQWGQVPLTTPQAVVALGRRHSPGPLQKAVPGLQQLAGPEPAHPVQQHQEQLRAKGPPPEVAVQTETDDMAGVQLPGTPSQPGSAAGEGERMQLQQTRQRRHLAQQSPRKAAAGAEPRCRRSPQAAEAEQACWPVAAAEAAACHIPGHLLGARISHAVSESPQGGHRGSATLHALTVEPAGRGDPLASQGDPEPELLLDVAAEPEAGRPATPQVADDPWEAAVRAAEASLLHSKGEISLWPRCLCTASSSQTQWQLLAAPVLHMHTLPPLCSRPRRSWQMPAQHRLMAMRCGVCIMQALCSQQSRLGTRNCGSSQLMWWILEQARKPVAVSRLGCPGRSPWGAVCMTRCGTRRA